MEAEHPFVSEQHEEAEQRHAPAQKRNLGLERPIVDAKQQSASEQKHTGAAQLELPSRPPALHFNYDAGHGIVLAARFVWTYFLWDFIIHLHGPFFDPHVFVHLHLRRVWRPSYV